MCFETVVKNYFEFFLSCFSNEFLRGFFAIKVNGSDVNPEICVIVKTRSYRQTENMYYLMKINRNSQMHGSFVY